MAGRGPAPKPADQRVRRNADPTALRIVESDPVAQPPLPEVRGGLSRRFCGGVCGVRIRCRRSFALRIGLS